MTLSLTQKTIQLAQPDDIYLRLRKQLNQVHEIELQIKNLKEERDQPIGSCCGDSRLRPAGRLMSRHCGKHTRTSTNQHIRMLTTRSSARS